LGFLSNTLYKVQGLVASAESEGYERDTKSRNIDYA